MQRLSRNLPRQRIQFLNASLYEGAFEKVLAFCAEDFLGFGKAAAAADVADYHLALPAFAGDGGGVEGGGHGAGVALLRCRGPSGGFGGVVEEGVWCQFALLGGFG